eukprot:scaffold28941_cov163-Isochrysis_galbana.AAC.1
MDGEIMGKGSESRRVVRHGVSRRVAASLYLARRASISMLPQPVPPVAHAARGCAPVLPTDTRTCTTL